MRNVIDVSYLVTVGEVNCWDALNEGSRVRYSQIAMLHLSKRKMTTKQAIDDELQIWS